MREQRKTSLVATQRERMLEDLRSANQFSSRFGLTLSERGMQELAKTRTQALTDHGRVELGGSAVRAIIEEFCDSPFCWEEYESTLAERTRSIISKTPVAIGLRTTERCNHAQAL
ncbi:MAG: DUF6323 family protein [Eubacteriales bacterium]